MNVRIFAAAALAVAVSTVAHGAIVDNLQGYYKLDETTGADVANAGSVAQGGTILTNVTTGATGVVGNAYIFNGNVLITGNAGATAARVNLGGTGATGPISVSQIADNLTQRMSTATAIDAADATSVTDVTLGAWVNPTQYRAGTAASSRSTLIGIGNSQFGFSLAGGGRLRFDYRSDGDNRSVFQATGATPFVELDRWSHVVATRAVSGGQNVLSLYIDGVNVQTTTNALTGTFQSVPLSTATDPVADAASLNLGTLASGGSSDIRDFSGRMDDVGIHVGRALTGTQIAAIAGLGRFSGAGLDAAGIDDVLDVHAAAAGSATVNGDVWSYTTAFAAPADVATTLVAGRHYADAAGNEYIILAGTAGNFTGVVNLVPEPTTLAALAGAAIVGLRRRRS